MGHVMLNFGIYKIIFFSSCLGILRRDILGYFVHTKQENFIDYYSAYFEMLPCFKRHVLLSLQHMYFLFIYSDAGVDLSVFLVFVSPGQTPKQVVQSPAVLKAYLPQHHTSRPPILHFPRTCWIPSLCLGQRTTSRRPPTSRMKIAHACCRKSETLPSKEPISVHWDMTHTEEPGN